MKKSVILACFFLLPVIHLTATHNRAGEITYRQVSGLTFEFTITTYTYTLSPADRSQLEVQWGDNTTSIAPRIPPPLVLPNYYQKNTYKATHTYPGPGVYEVVVEDPNRNFGVVNIPNSVNVVFSIKTVLLINPQIGPNSTPVLLNPPYDKAALGQLFIHNPAAYDPDGDSISYRLTVCTTEGGLPISNYTFPEASDTFYVNPVTGDLFWDTPVKTGIYNIAMDIEEWRMGIKIGNILRDMQVEVYETSNNPPSNPELEEFCVVAGELISFEVTSTDPDGDMVTHWDTGGVYLAAEPLPEFTTIDTGPGFITSRFEWQTTCDHVRISPYNWLLKAEDNNEEVSLVDIDNSSIRVIGPPVENLRAVPSMDAVFLVWDLYICSNITGYEVYRSAGSTGYVPDSCEWGVPAYLGYTLAGITSGWQDTVFLDNNAGAGLMQGMEYCYLVVAVFPDGSRSIASNEECGILVQGTPLITNVSVNNTGESDGSIYLAWAMPRDLDPAVATGPFEYLIYRSEGLWGADFSLIQSLPSTDLEDTTYTDTGLNTRDYAYSYKVELYNDAPGNRFLLGSPGIASSVFLGIVPSDNRLSIYFRKNVPWLNTSYVIYRQDPLTMSFDSIGTTPDTVFVDRGLANGVSYCYLVKSIGTYRTEGIIDPLINFSHENCGVPEDNEPPCPPVLTAYSECDSFYNVLNWTISTGDCWDDILQYRVFYSPLYLGALEEIGTITERDIRTFYHYPDETMAGCYAVMSVDSFGNESPLSNMVCLDECSYFELPNVFTPNQDEVNDYFMPKAYRFVKGVEIKIFNRWGDLVFEGSFDNPGEFRWDGRIMNTNRVVGPGVYYYICDVTEQRLTGPEVRNIVGFVYVFTEKNPSVGNEK